LDIHKNKMMLLNDLIIKNIKEAL